MPSLKLFFLHPDTFINSFDIELQNKLLIAEVEVSSIKQFGKNLLVFERCQDIVEHVISLRYADSVYEGVKQVQLDIEDQFISDAFSANILIDSLSIDNPFHENQCKDDLRNLYLFIVSITVGENEVFYTSISRSREEAYFIKFFEAKNKTTNTAAAFKILLNQFSSKRRNINHDKWYSKWKYDYEKEIKYTSFEGVDVWSLLRKFYLQIKTGNLKGFIPEINDEFQVWDYDNKIYEVTSPAEKKGYVSFITQADGRVTIKHKQFQIDQELRKENLIPNQDLKEENYIKFAEQLSGGVVFKLPPFRRKRFDVNIESLNTGNVYGVFMEICRIIDSEAMMVQVEIEYLRSRTLGPFERVEEEYDQICKFTEAFLSECSLVDLKRGYYSKLSFVKDFSIKNA